MLVVHDVYIAACVVSDRKQAHDANIPLEKHFKCSPVCTSSLMFVDLCADTACHLHFVTPKEEVSLCLSDATLLLSFSEVVVQTNQY